MTIKENKVVVKKGLLGAYSFKVVEVEYEIKKPNKVLLEIELFKGSILECEAYLRMLDNDTLILST